jgi:hypothetical protein
MDLHALNQLPVAALAVIATLVAALTAALTAVFVAGINVWSARWLARDAALREFRQAALQHLLDEADSSCSTMTRLRVAIERNDLPMARELIKPFAEMRVFAKLGYMPVVGADPLLDKVAYQFVGAYKECQRLVLAEVQRLSDGEGEPVSEDVLDAADSKLFQTVFRLRLAAEDFICSIKRSRRRLKRLLLERRRRSLLWKLPMLPKRHEHQESTSERTSSPTPDRASGRDHGHPQD